MKVNIFNSKDLMSNNNKEYISLLANKKKLHVKYKEISFK